MLRPEPDFGEDINAGVFSAVNNPAGEQLLNGIVLSMRDGVPGPHTRAALLRDIGALCRIVYRAGMDAGVAEQLTTTLGK